MTQTITKVLTDSFIDCAEFQFIDAEGYEDFCYASEFEDTLALYQDGGTPFTITQFIPKEI